jgi:translation initiation factor 3 subunit C
MLKRKIQEEGLRTYIFTYSPHYTAMSLEELSHIFELPQHNGTFPRRALSCV